MRTEFWLRRAANNITTEDEARDIVREYVAATQANPLSVQLGGSIAPSDNVNRGSDDGILEFEGIPLQFLLPEDQRALSGIEYAASVQLSYRLSQNDRQRTALTAAIAGQTYTLSDEARDLLDSSPSADVRAVDGDDFATAVVQLGLTHQRSDLTTLGPVGYGINFGTYWRGGERIIDFTDYSLSQTIVIDSDTAYNLRFSVRDQAALSDEVLDTVSYDLSATFNTTLDSRDRLQFNVTRSKTDAGFDSSYTQYSGRLGYDFAEPLFGARWGTSVELGYRNYPSYTTTLNGRRDHFATIATTTVFEDFSYFGFAPSLEVSATRNRSNAEELNSTAVQVRVGIASNF